MTVVPEAEQLAEPQWAEVERIIEQQLAGRPPKMRRQLGLLIRVINALPLLTSGRRFTALAPDARLRLLDGLSRAPVLLLRRGIWGLRTLVMMGYYARPEGAAAIGYRADARGWSARR